MEDFFANLDWDEMAVVGGIAEEVAETRCDHRRRTRDHRSRQQKSIRDPEDHFNFEKGFQRKPLNAQYSRRTARRKPLEQYQYDVREKRKSPHAPLFGPSKFRRGAIGNPRIFTDTTIYGVHTKNAHLVSEAFLSFVCTILCDYPDQDIDQIVFDPNGRPAIDGREIFSTFDRQTLTITINLRRHFANAVRIAEHGYTGLSMHAIIWNTMIGSVLRELKHALDDRKAGYIDYFPRQEQERIADRWASSWKN